MDGWGLVGWFRFREQRHMVPFLEAAHPLHLSTTCGKDSGCWESGKYHQY